MRKDNELVSNKSNVLIQNYAWKLKQYELKIFELLCCCYNTKYYDAQRNIIRISLNDFASELHDDTLLEGGYYYKQFKTALKKLSDTSVWVVKEEKIEHLLRIVNTYDIIPKDSVVVCYMSDDYKEHMEKHPLGNAFVELKIINAMTSKYSINLYNLMRSWNGKDIVVFDVEYLKEKLQCTSSTYDNICKLKNIINKAVNEINSLSSLEVSYDCQKQGKKIAGFRFYIDNKDEEFTNIDEAYIKTPLEKKFDNPSDKTDYYYEWLEYHFPDADEYDNLDNLFSVIPENIHQYNKDKALAIQNVAGSSIMSLSDEFDNHYNVGYSSRTATIIRNFVRRKWNNNLENKVEKNAFSYFMKSFEFWCEEQKKIKH